MISTTGSPKPIIQNLSCFNLKVPSNPKELYIFQLGISVGVSRIGKLSGHCIMTSTHEGGLSDLWFYTLHAFNEL